MPAYNYDNTLLGQYIRQIENPDSIGFNPQNRRWYAPPERGYDINNRGMGVDIVYNPEAANIVQGRDGKWLSEQEERDLRNRQLEYDLDILKKNTPAPLLANTYSPEGKAMAIGLLYRGDRKNLLIKDTPLKRAYYSGDENKFTQEVQRYYNKSTLKERRKQNDAFMKMKQQQKVKKSPSLLKIVKNRQASLDNWSNKWRKFEDGGYLNDSQQTPWDMLSMEQKSEFIKEAVKHGLRSMQEIKDAYNQLAMQQDSDEMQQQDYAQQQDDEQYPQESIYPQEEAQQDSYYQPQQEEEQDDEDPYGAEYDKMMYALGGNLFAGGGAQNRARPLFMRNGQIYKWRGVSNGMRNHIVQWEGPSMYRPTKDTITGKIVPKNVSIEKMEQAFFNAIPDDLKAFVFNNPDYADALFSYGYNVGMGAMRSRVLPTMRNYLKGKASARELVNTMRAQYDNRLRGLAIRREYEKNLAYAALTGEISPLLKEESKKWDSNMNQVNQIINNPQGPGIIANPDFQPYNPEVFKKVMLGDQSDTPDTFTYSDLQAMREQQKEDAAAANAAKEEFAKEIWGDENTEKLEGLKALQTLQYFPEEQPDQAQIIQKPLTLEKRNPYSVNVGAYGGNLFLFGGLEDTEDSPEENTEEEIDTSTAPVDNTAKKYTTGNYKSRFANMYVSLLNQKIPKQLAFDQAHLSSMERGKGKLYINGTFFPEHDYAAYGRAAKKSLTTGQYTGLFGVKNFQEFSEGMERHGYRGAKFKKPQLRDNGFWNYIYSGREKNKRIANEINKLNGLSPVVYNSYMPDDTFSPVQSDEGNITAYGGLLNNPNLFEGGGPVENKGWPDDSQGWNNSDYHLDTDNFDSSLGLLSRKVQDAIQTPYEFPQKAVTKVNMDINNGTLVSRSGDRFIMKADPDNPNVMMYYNPKNHTYGEYEGRPFIKTPTNYYVIDKYGNPVMKEGTVIQEDRSKTPVIDKNGNPIIDFGYSTDKDGNKYLDFNKGKTEAEVEIDRERKFGPYIATLLARRDAAKSFFQQVEEVTDPSNLNPAGGTAHLATSPLGSRIIKGSKNFLQDMYKPFTAGKRLRNAVEYENRTNSELYDLLNKASYSYGRDEQALDDLLSRAPRDGFTIKDLRQAQQNPIRKSDIKKQIDDLEAKRQVVEKYDHKVIDTRMAKEYNAHNGPIDYTKMTDSQLEKFLLKNGYKKANDGTYVSNNGRNIIFRNESGKVIVKDTKTGIEQPIKKGLHDIYLSVTSPAGTKVDKDVTIPIYGTTDSNTYHIASPSYKSTVQVTGDYIRGSRRAPQYYKDKLLQQYYTYDSVEGVSFPEGYINDLNKNIDYVTTQIPGSVPFGSSIAVTKGGMIHPAHDIDLLVTDKNLDELANKGVKIVDSGNPNMKRINLGDIDGISYPGDTGDLELNFISRTPDGKGTVNTPLSRELYQQMFPEEYTQKVLKTPYDKITIDKTPEELLQAVQNKNLSKTLQDWMFMNFNKSTANKHLPRIRDFIQNSVDSKSANAALEEALQASLGGKGQLAPKLDWSNEQANREFLGKINYPFDPDIVAKDPHKMQSIADLWYYDNSVLGRGSIGDDYAQAIERQFNYDAAQGGGTANGAATNTVKNGFSGYNPTNSMYNKTYFLSQVPQEFKATTPMEFYNEVSRVRGLPEYELSDKDKQIIRNIGIALRENLGETFLYSKSNYNLNKRLGEQLGILQYQVGNYMKERPFIGRLTDGVPDISHLLEHPEQYLGFYQRLEKPGSRINSSIQIPQGLPAIDGTFSKQGLHSDFIDHKILDLQNTNTNTREDDVRKLYDKMFHTLGNQYHRSDLNNQRIHGLYNKYKENVDKIKKNAIIGGSLAGATGLGYYLFSGNDSNNDDDNESEDENNKVTHNTHAYGGPLMTGNLFGDGGIEDMADRMNNLDYWTGMLGGRQINPEGFNAKPVTPGAVTVYKDPEDKGLTTANGKKFLYYPTADNPNVMEWYNPKTMRRYGDMNPLGLDPFGVEIEPVVTPKNGYIDDQGHLFNSYVKADNSKPPVIDKNGNPVLMLRTETDGNGNTTAVPIDNKTQLEKDLNGYWSKGYWGRVLDNATHLFSDKGPVGALVNFGLLPNSDPTNVNMAYSLPFFRKDILNKLKNKLLNLPDGYLFDIPDQDADRVISKVKGWMQSEDYARRLDQAGKSGADLRDIAKDALVPFEYNSGQVVKNIENNPAILGRADFYYLAPHKNRVLISERAYNNPDLYWPTLYHEVGGHTATYGIDPYINYNDSEFAAQMSKAIPDIQKALDYNERLVPKMTDVELAKKLNLLNPDEFAKWKKDNAEWLKYLYEPQEIRARGVASVLDARDKKVSISDYVDKYTDKNGYISKEAPEQLQNLNNIYTVPNLKKYLKGFLGVSPIGIMTLSNSNKRDTQYK